MNEQLKALAEQYACLTETMTSVETEYILDADDLQDLVDAVRQDEREANVKLLEDFAKTNMVPAKDTWHMGLIAGANALRARSQT